MPNNYIAWKPSKINIFLHKIKRNDSNITEIACYPCFFDNKSAYPYNKKREEEIKVLGSEGFVRVAKNYELISYDQI